MNAERSPATDQAAELDELVSALGYQPPEASADDLSAAPVGGRASSRFSRRNGSAASTGAPVYDPAAPVEADGRIGSVPDSVSYDPAVPATEVVGDRRFDIFDDPAPIPPRRRSSRKADARPERVEPTEDDRDEGFDGPGTDVAVADPGEGQSEAEAVPPPPEPERLDPGPDAASDAVDRTPVDGSPPPQVGPAPPLADEAPVDAPPVLADGPEPVPPPPPVAPRDEPAPASLAAPVATPSDAAPPPPPAAPDTADGNGNGPGVAGPVASVAPRPPLEADRVGDPGSRPTADAAAVAPPPQDRHVALASPPPPAADPGWPTAMPLEGPEAHAGTAPTPLVPPAPGAVQGLVDPAGPPSFQTSASSGATAASAATATDGGKSRRRRMIRSRKVRRVIRHIDPWSVLTFSVIFHLCLFGALLLAGSLVWSAASASGTIDNVESFIRDLGDYDSWEIQGDAVLRAGVIIAGMLTLASTVLVVLLTVIFNLISDLIGGIRVTVIEEEVHRVEVPRRGLLRR